MKVGIVCIEGHKTRGACAGQRDGGWPRAEGVGRGVRRSCAFRRPKAFGISRDLYRRSLRGHRVGMGKRGGKGGKKKKKKKDRNNNKQQEHQHDRIWMGRNVQSPVTFTADRFEVTPGGQERWKGGKEKKEKKDR